MDLVKKGAVIGLGALTVFGGLFIKNYISERSMKSLSQQEVVKILKVYRKERYVLFKQIATFAVNIMQQMKGNLNQPAIEQFLNGPECPFKFKEESEAILESVCTQLNTTVDTLAFSLEQLSKDPEIIRLQQQQEADYKTSISGRLPFFDAKVPQNLDKKKFYQLQNRMTKATYMHQVRIFKKLQEYSEMELQQNPNIIKDLGNPDETNEEMLRAEGLGSEYEPATAVYDAASLQFRTHPDFRMKIQQIEKGYQNILMKYIQRIQTKTVTDAELNQMEEEIIYFEPISI